MGRRLSYHATQYFYIVCASHGIKKDFTAPRMKVLRNEHLLGPLPVCLSNAGVRENALRLQALHGPGKMVIHLYVSGKLTTNP